MAEPREDASIFGSGTGLKEEVEEGAKMYIAERRELDRLPTGGQEGCEEEEEKGYLSRLVLVHGARDSEYGLA